MQLCRIKICAERTEPVIKSCKEKTKKNILEENYQSNTRSMWNSMMHITNLQPARKTHLISDDTQKADDFNCFFLRFDNPNFDQECSKELNSISTTDRRDNRVLIHNGYVQSLLKKKCVQRNLLLLMVFCLFLLKVCAEDLSPVWSSIFQRYIDSKVVPAIWKKSILIPVPKTSRPTENNDFRPIAKVF